MTDLLDNEALLWTCFVASVVIFAASLLAMPAIVVRIPADYFTHEKRPPGRLAQMHPALRIVLRVGKNILGVILLLAGLAMLVLPGQGVLTMLVGIMLMDFPGKYRFEHWLICRRWIHRPINWLRRRRGVEPLRVGCEGDAGDASGVPVAAPGSIRRR